MRRLTFWGLLALALGACGGGPAASPDQGGGRPQPRVTSLFQFPALPSSGGKLYLQFRDSNGTSAKQEEVQAGKTEVVIEIQNLGTPDASVLVSPESLKPADATLIQAPSPSSARVYGLAPILYQDKNGNGQFESAELLYMTHDRILYATSPFSASYTQPIAGKSMVTSVQAAQGWSRLEHYVYLPSGTTVFLRTLSSTTDRTFLLHRETPENSM